MRGHSCPHWEELRVNLVSKSKDSFVPPQAPFPAHAIPTQSLAIISHSQALPLRLYSGKLKWLVLQRNTLVSDGVATSSAAKPWLKDTFPLCTTAHLTEQAMPAIFSLAFPHLIQGSAGNSLSKPTTVELEQQTEGGDRE